MAGIILDINDDIKRLQQLKAEIESVKKALTSINVKVDIDIAKGLEARLQKLTGQYDALVGKIAASEAKVKEAESRMNSATQRITEAQERIAKSAGSQGGTSASSASAGVQAQARAYEELERQIDGVLGTRDENVRLMVEEQNAIRILNAQIKEVRKNYTGSDGIVSQRGLQLLEKYNNDLLTHKAALSQVRQELLNQAKLNNAAGTSMNALSQSLSRMRIAYRELTEEERKSPFGQELLASIQQADAKIKELDATIGNHQRNVGNYASGFNSLGMSVQQIVRELPAATMGLNMFFLAISNNLPILTDEIKRAVEMNKQLKASNQDTVPVWKQLVSSIFSWQTALIVAITAMSMYGKEIVSWIGNLFKAKDTTEEVRIEQEKLNKAMADARKSAAEETASLRVLYAMTQNTSASMQDRIAAVKQLQSQYPAYFGNLSKEAILAGKTSAAYQQLTKDIMSAAYARAYEERISDLAKKNVNEYRGSLADFNYMQSNRAAYDAAKAYMESAQSTQDRRNYQRSRAGWVYDAEAVERYEKYTKIIEDFEERRSRWQRHNEKYKRNEAVMADYEEEILKHQSALMKTEQGSDYVEDTKSQENEAKRIAKERERIAKERLKAQSDIDKDLLSLQQKNQDDEIALMRDGTQKKLAEIDNDYKKRIAEIDKQEAEFKKKNKEAGLQGLGADGLTKEQQNALQEAADNAAKERERQTQEVYAAEAQAMRDYLKEYGTYQEKRLAIIEDYNNKIAKTNIKGEKSSLVKEQQKALQDLDIEAAKTTSSINELFGDMTDKSLADLRRLSEEGQNLLDFLQGGEWDADKGKGFGITEDQFKAITSNPESMKAISDAIINIRKQAEELRPPLEKVTQGLKDLFNAGNDNKKLNKALQDVMNGIQEIQQSMSFLADSFTTLGDSFGSNFLSSIGEGLNIANNAISSTMQGMQAGSLFGPVGSAVGGAVGLVSSLGSAFAAIHDKKNEKRIQRLQDQIDTLTKSYDKLGDAVEDAYSKDASGLIEDQNKLLEQQKVLIEQQIKEEKDKKDTDKSRIKEWQDQIDEINKTIEDNKEKAIDAIFGEDIQSAIEDFVNAYADAWEQSEDRAKSAKDTVKDMMRQMVTESIKSFIQSSGAMDEIRKKLQEFYADNILSGWEQEYIYNMAEDLQKQLDSKFAWADSLMTDTTSTAQSASSKGFETMSQDTGEELNGRTTAIYEAELNIANTTTEQLAVLRAIYGLIGGNIAGVASESKQIMSTSYIQQNNISFPTAQLDALVAKVEGLDAKVADLVAFGADNRLSMQGVDTYIEDATKNSTKSLSLLNEIKRNTQNI